MSEVSTEPYQREVNPPICLPKLQGQPTTPEVLLKAMQIIRAVESALQDAYVEGRFEGPLHVSLGQEEAAVGIVAGMGTEDVLISNHRGHGHALAFGLDPQQVVGEIVGDPCGYGSGRGGSMHIFAPQQGFLGTNGIVGDGAGLGVGAALALRQNRRGAVAVAIFGDGAMATGIVSESFNLASLWSLPIVFVCENNGYAEMTPTSVHLSSPPSSRAEAFGLRVAHVEEGSDPQSVAKAVRAAVEHARHGKPCFVEIVTYRWGGHYVGDPAIYRPSSEGETWRKKHDPILQLGIRLGKTESEIEEQNKQYLRSAQELVLGILSHAHRSEH